MLNERWNTTELSKTELSKERNEEREIVENIVQTLFIDKFVGNKGDEYDYIILKDKTWYSYYTFGGSVGYKISSKDAYVFLSYTNEAYDSVPYYYPLIQVKRLYTLVRSYLSKLGFISDVSREPYGAVPSNGLKYLAIVLRLEGYGNKYAVMELVDIDTMARNTNLSSLVPDSPRYINKDDVLEIVARLALQRVFNGFSFVEAEHIMELYYRKLLDSYEKYFEHIKNAYKHVFQPYRVVYDLETKQFKS